MTRTESRRYNDRDVVADFDNLHGIAVAYLRQYGGNFHVLRKARAALTQVPLLEIEQLRVVLNCMLADPMVRSMPTPKGHTLYFDASDVNSTDEPFEVFEPPLPTPPPSRAGKWIDLKSRPNTEKPFWYSTQTNAYLIHIVTEVRVSYRNPSWYEQVKWYDTVPPYHRRFEVRPKFFCKSLLNIPSKMRAAAPEEIKELIDGGRKWCPTCEEHWIARLGAPALPPATTHPEV